MAKAGIEVSPGISIYFSHENAKGEEGVIVTMCLPSKAMQRLQRGWEGKQATKYIHKRTPHSLKPTITFLNFYSSDLVFTVRRRQPELVTPSKPTPREFKPLSDIDDQDGFRYHVPLVLFYPFRPNTMVGKNKRKDPAHVIKMALAKTLGFYYPFAGRLREGPERKLVVDCGAQGVLFVEADADVTLDQFGHLQPLFPCFQELLYKVPDSEGIIDCPLLHIQVTRLKCGGFIFALRMNHTMCDGSEEKETQHTIQRSFFFGPTEIAAIRELLPYHLRDQCTKFELLTASLWRCRTTALQLQPNDDVRLMCAINARGKTKGGLEIPEGYYGNAIVFPAVVTTAGKLTGGNSIGHALELVKKVKGEISEEYVQSVADLMAIRGRPGFTTARSWTVSNVTRVGFRDVDFGWGKAVFGGVAKAVGGAFPGMSYYFSHENAKGEEGVVVTICLPSKAMERFIQEMDDMLNEKA
ncbi:benzyl alcohol O-benzoyltransferase-like [Senna tora]|uniref:Benzyl alcohol O-benzoyltransferase-like n=1 Tax=Senna tora TaxID=362788 RepID=A0A834TWH5_9FABA|nr:benzyl alcohol O-benzoyltransferase-like [Senna tora]